MLPVSQKGDLKGGILAFVKRRARRILPPYYAALVFSWVLLVSVPHTQIYASAAWPLFAPKVVISHLLLFHNLNHFWAYKINGALWSVATEWQIYFVFALLLLPVYKKLGIIPSLLIAGIVGVIPNLLLHHRFDSASFHYLALFGFGMVAAEVNFSSRIAPIFQRWSWGWISAAFGVLFLLYFSRHGNQGNTLYLDSLLGAATAALIIASTKTSQGSGRSLILSIFSSRFAVTLGTFSYSIYLIHDPMLYSGVTVLSSLAVPATIAQTILVTCVPVIVGITYLFHLAFERPFMNKPAPKNEREAEIAAIVNPAP